MISDLESKHAYSFIPESLQSIPEIMTISIITLLKGMQLRTSSKYPLSEFRQFLGHFPLPRLYNLILLCSPIEYAPVGK